MDIILKVIAGVLIAIVVARILVQQGSGFVPLLLITVCCMIFMSAFSYFKPVLAFIDELQTMGQLNSTLIKVLFRITGISLLAEIASLICSDMGNAAYAKALQILTTAAILWLSVPLFEELIALLEAVLEGI